MCVMIYDAVLLTTQPVLLLTNQRTRRKHPVSSSHIQKMVRTEPVRVHLAFHCAHTDYRSLVQVQCRSEHQIWRCQPNPAAPPTTSNSSTPTNASVTRTHSQPQLNGFGKRRCRMFVPLLAGAIWGHSLVSEEQSSEWLSFQRQGMPAAEDLVSTTTWS